jgi:hypothetical protein
VTTACKTANLHADKAYDYSPASPGAVSRAAPSWVGTAGVLFDREPTVNPVGREEHHRRIMVFFRGRP